jgi:hypothetical protein
MQNDPAVEEVRKTLGTIVKLLAAQVKPDLPMTQRAPLLDRLGVDYEAIAAVCSTTPNVVRARVAEARKAAAGRTSKKGGNHAKASAETQPRAEASV